MSTIAQITGNLIKTCMGVGILALPATSLHSGGVAFIVLVALITLWVYYCMKLLIEAENTLIIPLLVSNEDPYKTVARAGLKSFGVFILNFSFIVTLIGVGAAYQITFNDLVTHLNWDKWGFHIGKENWFWTAVFGVCILPLVMLRTMNSLSYASQAGNYILGGVMVVVLVYGAIYNKFHADLAMLWPTNYMEIANLFGVICFSMGVAFIALSSRKTMSNPFDFPKALKISLAVPSSIYVVFAVLGVFFYSSAEGGIQANVLNNMNPATVWYFVAAIGLSLVCFLSYPIAVYPALIACEAWIKETESRSMVTNYKRILQRVLVVVVTCAIAYFVPFFKTVVSFNILCSSIVCSMR